MTDFLLLIHGTVLAVAIAEFVRCSDKCEAVMATHKRTAETSRELRLRIIKELRRNLRPVFKDREVIKVTSLLDNNGDPWEPGTGDPDQTEAFQDAVSNFIHGQIEPLADYVLLRSSYERWDV